MCSYYALVTVLQVPGCSCGSFLPLDLRSRRICSSPVGMGALPSNSLSPISIAWNLILLPLSRTLPTPNLSLQRKFSNTIVSTQILKDIFPIKLKISPATATEMPPKKKVVADEGAETAGDGVSTDSCKNTLSKTDVYKDISLDTEERASSRSPVQLVLL
jgi:hypothetical protein